MSEIFPEPIINLPEALIPVDGVKGYISQAENNQIIFMEFKKDVDIPEHTHGSQWEIVLRGKVDVVINGIRWVRIFYSRILSTLSKSLCRICISSLF